MAEARDKGRVVRSIAGHDKDRFFVVVTSDARRVFLADGKLRKLEKPKAKNVLHVRPTGTLIDMEDCKTDKKLRALLRPFQNGCAETAAAREEGGNQHCPKRT